MCAVVVNLAEPSPGDLERVFNAYVETRVDLKACEAKLAEVTANCISLSLHESRMQVEREQADSWERAYETVCERELRIEKERDAARAEVERLDARYRAKLDQFNALEMLTKVRDQYRAALQAHHADCRRRLDGCALCQALEGGGDVAKD